MSLGFFFGAGAEVGYGLPSGGQFALELFRRNVSSEKTALRRQLQEEIDRQTPYSTNWLPDEFWKKRIHAFGRNEFAALVESSIEYRRLQMIEFLNAFDAAADAAMTRLGLSRERVNAAYQDQFGRQYGERLYSQVVRINPKLAANVSLFDSEFFSALLDLIATEAPYSNDGQRYAGAFLQLLVGAYGQDLVQRLNQEIFLDAPENIPIFDDVSGMFRLEFNKAGVSALELLVSEQRSFSVDDEAPIGSILCSLSHEILESLFSQVLDYQSLVDSHFRYLFNPRAEWAKFTKMVIFLRSARELIRSRLDDLVGLPDGGYYHDVLRAYQADQIDISAVGTSNYNSLFQLVMEKQETFGIPVYHLNGSVNDFYNPYKNTIVTCPLSEVPGDQIHVPFILTQSGLKPLTSVTMSRRYVDLYDRFASCEAVVCVGYDFNVDDSHINGLFRELVESGGKKLYWVKPGTPQDAEQFRRTLVKKLRLSPASREKLNVIPIDTETRTFQGELWLEAILKDHAQTASS